jgi:probable phosphoglycerate mutase
MATPRRFSQDHFKGPPGSTEILLVRHGASADAVEGEDFELLDGQGNPPLSEMGQRQAELVAERLMRELPFAAVYITSLRRTAETAAPLVARCGLTPIVEPELREVFLGEWEGGLFRQKIADQDPLAQRMFAEQRWDVIPGAESSAAFGTRIEGAIERIAAAHSDERVIVFSHGAAIGQAMAHAAGSEPFAFIAADNTSISRLIITSDRWLVRGFNETAHLLG